MLGTVLALGQHVKCQPPLRPLQSWGVDASVQAAAMPGWEASQQLLAMQLQAVLRPRKVPCSLHCTSSDNIFNRNLHQQEPNA